MNEKKAPEQTQKELILEALNDLERIRNIYSNGHDGLYYALLGVEVKIKSALER